MRLFKLTLEYDGTAYHGWQTQPGLATVQGAIEEALARIMGGTLHVVGAGRTDAGVHALGQVASFPCGTHLPPEILQRALNATLPQDIAVVEACEAPTGFHAQRDAQARTYRYTILHRHNRSAHWRDRALHVPHPLDVPAMNAAAARLLGEHDFSAFRAAGCTAPTPVRRITEARVDREGDLVHFTVTADAFLRHMVRILTGTLIQVGEGRLAPQEFDGVLAARDRRRAGKTVLPHGLTLVRVHYA